MFKVNHKDTRTTSLLFDKGTDLGRRSGRQ